MDTDESAGTAKRSQYQLIRRELVSRTRDPVRSLTFVTYFVVAMLVVAPLSIWVELYSYLIPVVPHDPTLAGESPVKSISSLASLRTAILTFFPAVVATAAMQLLWADGKELRSFGVLFLTVVGAATAAVYPDRITDCTAVFAGTLLTVLALWFWWVANAKDTNLLGELDPADAIGGRNATGRLDGDLSGFST